MVEEHKKREWAFTRRGWQGETTLDFSNIKQKRVLKRMWVKEWPVGLCKMNAKILIIGKLKTKSIPFGENRVTSCLTEQTLTFSIENVCISFLISKLGCFCSKCNDNSESLLFLLLWNGCVYWQRISSNTSLYSCLLAILKQFNTYPQAYLYIQQILSLIFVDKLSSIQRREEDIDSRVLTFLKYASRRIKRK